MTHGIGKPPVQVGEEPTPETLPIYEGSTPDDMQQWIWSLYRSEEPALVRGAVVTGRSDMSYDVSGGVAIFPAGDCKTIAVPFEATTVATADAPTSGTRKDYLYVTDDGAVQVKAGSRPAGSVALDVRSVPANITATTGTSSEYGNRVYAPLFGASMGELLYWKHSAADLTPITDTPGQERTMTVQTLTLDSDRRLDFLVQTSIEMSRNANVETWGWKKASFLWSIWIDGERRWGVELGVEEFAETKSVSTSFSLTAGTYQIELRREKRLQGTDDPDNDHPVLRTGGSEQWPGTVFKIVDLGGVE